SSATGGASRATFSFSRCAAICSSSRMVSKRKEGRDYSSLQLQTANLSARRWFEKMNKDEQILLTRVMRKQFHLQLQVSRHANEDRFTSASVNPDVASVGVSRDSSCIQLSQKHDGMRRLSSI